MDENLKEKFKKVVDDYADASVKFVDYHEEFAQDHPELYKKLRMASDKVTRIREVLDNEVSGVAPQLVQAYNELTEKTHALLEIWLNFDITTDEFNELLDEPGVRETLDIAQRKFSGSKWSGNLSPN